MFTVTNEGTWTYPYGPMPLRFEWFKRSYVRSLRYPILFFDVLVAAWLIAGCAWTFETRFQRLAFAKTFSIKSLMVFIAWLAFCLVMLRGVPVTELSAVAFVVAYLAVGLAWLAFFDVLGIVCSRFTSLRNATEAPYPESASPDSR
jgi:hypothetical protein